MSRLLIIGCGGVAGVAISKCCQNSGEFFTDMHSKPHKKASVMR